MVGLSRYRAYNNNSTYWEAKEMVTLVIVFICVLISLLVIYAVLKYIYGKNHTKWQSILFSKQDGFRSVFLSRRDKDGKDGKGRTGADS